MKNILVFNDISGLGNCSLSANLPIFAHFGHYSMPICTGMFSSQTGFSGFLCQPNTQVLQFAKQLLSERNADVVYIGFCNNVETLQQVTQVVEECKRQGAMVLVDPVMGDNGKFYPVFNNDYLQQMKKLVALADYATPNLTEACMLLNLPYDQVVAEQNNAGYLGHCGKLLQGFLATTGCKNAVVTGIVVGNLIGNVVLQGQATKYVTTDRNERNFSGTGDLFSSIVLAELLEGYDLFQATQASAEFISRSAKNTLCKDVRFGVEFAPLLHTLLK